ncbi:hypothetical protein D3C87_1807990 [compost metagenome]
MGAIFNLLSTENLVIALVVVVLLVMGVGLVNLKTEINAREFRRSATAESSLTCERPEVP